MDKVKNIVEEVSKNYLFSEFNQVSENMIAELKSKLSDHFTDVFVNLSFHAATGEVTVDTVCDGTKQNIVIRNQSY